jgi:hypothetical protein
MGKKKETAPVKLPKADEVASAKPLVEKVARTRKRLAAVREKTPSTSDPKHRRARKRVKRAQRKLRRTLAYAVARAKPAPAGGEAPAAS